ncbi:MAG: RagB/SusD family nutrient uptake outer membrane protein [Bacteroidetes bacterium]|nr:RagB/SusD family nutrient uptake outer membrane protein [Bacteroidota bacterium]
MLILSSKYNVFPSHIKVPLLMLILCIPFTFSCKKFVEVDPPATQLESSTVFTDDKTAIASITGIYSSMMQSASGFASGGQQSVTVLASLSADDLVSYNFSTDIQQFYENSVNSSNSAILAIWGELYSYIYRANAIIEGLSKSNSVTASLREQLTEEAKFIRAFSFFYLVNLFGDVPLITSTDYHINQVASRNSVNEVYEQIISDLKETQSLLPDNYSFAGNERVRPTKWAAMALLARVYLYKGDWANAESLSSSVINNTTLFSLKELDNVFLANSTEAIWQLQPVSPGYNTYEGNLFILNDIPQFVSLSPALINVFEEGDLRKAHWVDSISAPDNTYYYADKYKIKINDIVTEYSMVLRLAEQYLLRAEARAQQDNISGAQEDLNIIRNRAGLGNTTANDQSSLIAAIIHERRVELFTEWGHRWLDLKRDGLADNVLSGIKPNWKATDTLYPLPQSEILSDTHLNQNEGY